MKAQATLLAIAGSVGLMITTAMTAQQPAAKPSSSMQDMQGMDMKNGDTQQGHTASKPMMMGGCDKHMHAMMSANAQATKDIRAAKQSNDPERMRAALDEAEKALDPTNEHMQGCMKMMNMMQKMNGTRGTKMSDQMKGKGQANSSQK
jgi:hypothetical protein